MEKIYESKKNSGVFIKADIDTVDKRTKTLFATNVSDNKTISMSVATLKRWWKEVSDTTETPEENTIEEEPTVDTNAEVEVETSTPNEVINEEPVVEEKPKKKAKKSSKAKAEPKVNIDVDTFRNDIEDTLIKGGFTKVSYNGMTRVSLFRFGKKTQIRLCFGNKSLSVLVRPEVVPENVEYSTYKFFLSANLKLGYDDNAKSLIYKMMSHYSDTLNK